MLNSAGVEGTTASNDPVDFVAFLDEELYQVTPVLSRDTSDQGNLASGIPIFEGHGKQAAKTSMGKNLYL